MQIATRFCGPPTSGNGGYVCGLLAQHLGEPAVVRLHRPPPLETELRVEPSGQGVRLLADQDLVAEGRPASISLDLPEAPSFSEAIEAARRFKGFERHPFECCFVCGPAREPGDGMRLFAGPVKGREIVATPWEPDATLCDERGVVSPEFVWAALDCPGGFAFDYPDGASILLGQLAARLDGQVSASERCVVIGWNLGGEGRKHFTATALFGEGGEPIAVAEATWIEVAPPA
jgi:hypothetical protein